MWFPLVSWENVGFASPKMRSLPRGARLQAIVAQANALASCRERTLGAWPGGLKIRLETLEILEIEEGPPRSIAAAPP